MLAVIVHWLLSALALLVVAQMVPGFRLRGYGTALLAALVVGLANAVLWPVLFFLTLPVNLLTLGLFTFVISAAMLKLGAALVTGFDIDGWIPAILGAFLLAIVGILFRAVLV